MIAQVIETKTRRLHNLDYLRGIAALGIMIFHYASWLYGRFEADTFLGRVGIYGVSIFYILSGLTLYYVYFQRIQADRNSIADFFIKRVFRIFPLLWLVIIATVLMSPERPDVSTFILNITGLFGFVKWDAYIGVGVWSIGNELVFYVFFPVFVFTAKRSRSLLILLSIMVFSIYLYFAFSIIDRQQDLFDQWHYYVNPLNQVFLFFCGFCIGHFLFRLDLPATISVALIGIGLVIFIFYPAGVNPVNLVTGVSRIVFTICCVLICVGFYKITIGVPNVLDKVLAFLGEASYSIYLLHPIVYRVVGVPISVANKHLFPVPGFARMILSMFLTFIASYVVYTFFEKYFMRLGREVASKVANYSKTA